MTVERLGRAIAPWGIIVFLLGMLAFASSFAGMDDAKKISEMRAEGQESLWHFLGRLPSSFEAQIFYAVALFGTLGMFANYAKQWLKGQITGNLLSYLFHDNLRGTLLSFSAAIGTGVGGIMAGVFETSSGDFVGWFNVMALSVMNGFTWDSTLNGGQQPTEKKEG